MIHLFGICWRRLDYVQKSLDSFIKTASEPVSITVADNKSENSKEIIEYLQSLLKEKKIARILEFEENMTGYAYARMLKDFPPDDSETFFLATDFDLVVPDGCDWIKIIRDAWKAEPNMALSGCTLDMVNYVPPNWGYGGDSDSFGLWCMAIHREKFFKYFNFNGPFYDFLVRQLMGVCGVTQKLLDIRFYHLGWDIWKDDEEYWKIKVGTPGEPHWSMKGRPANTGYKLHA